MSSIGEILREARKKKGTSEEVASKAVKMKLERLRDLEENRYDHFPARIYVTSFLKHYAEYLGIDPKEILEKFNQDNPAPEPKPIFDPKQDQPVHSPVEQHIPGRPSPFSLTPTGQAVLISFFVLAITLGIGTWWVVYRIPNHNNRPSSGTVLAPEPAHTSTSISETSLTPQISAPTLTLGTNQPPAQAPAPAVP